jgi:hypothetical protein
VAEAHVRLRAGVIARLGGVNEFESATTRTPYHVFFNPWLGSEAYGAPQGASWAFSAIFQDATVPYIGLTNESEYSRVVSHEWGHYAVHMTYGDAAYASLPGGKHGGWKEADSRGLAWSEDLATFIGQWGTGTVYPESAGAMNGHWSDYSQHPEGNALNMLWPNNRRLDTVLVEGIAATILSRAAQKFGFPRVYGVLKESKPLDLVAFMDSWNRAAEGKTADMADLQKIYIDERIVWRMRGKVVGESDKPGEPPRPLEGATVRLLAMSGEELPTSHELLDAPGVGSILTETGGTFRVCLPPGAVKFAVSAPGYARQEFPFTVDTAPSTRTMPEESPPFVLKRGPQYVWKLAAVQITPALAPLVRKVGDGSYTLHWESERPKEGVEKTLESGWGFTVTWNAPPEEIIPGEDVTIAFSPSGSQIWPACATTDSVGGAIFNQRWVMLEPDDQTWRQIVRHEITPIGGYSTGHLDKYSKNMVYIGSNPSYSGVWGMGNTWVLQRKIAGLHEFIICADVVTPGPRGRIAYVYDLKGQ